MLPIKLQMIETDVLFYYILNLNCLLFAAVDLTF
jgi:hypothetical protein